MPTDHLTTLLHQWNSREPQALPRLASAAYDDLHGIAVAYLLREHSHHTLQPTALVHELYLRLQSVDSMNLTDPSHFFAFSAKLMRMILIDHARAHRAGKRPDSNARVPLREDMVWIDAVSEDVLALDAALEELERLDPRKVRTLELRYFLGCTNDEAARLLHVSRPTIDRDLESAKSWLYRRLALPSTPRPVQPTLAIPTARFGPYRAVSLLARGGTSTVYRARPTAAIKITGQCDEQELLVDLEHPAIPRLLHAGVSSQGDHYLVTELLDGQTLDRYCARNHLDIPARLQLLCQLSAVLDFVHRAGIVHLDLKPANILVDSTGALKLLDFGNGRRLDAPARAARPMSTPRYASPEQLRGETTGIPSDIFSFAVVACEILSGRWPFGDPNSVLTELDRATGRSQPPKLPPSLQPLQSCLSPNPDHRPSSLAEVARELSPTFAANRPTPPDVSSLRC